MSWDSLIGSSRDVLTLAALVGAVWSSIVFVRKISEDREATRVARLKKWRKATVQKVLHQSVEYMTAEQITAWLKSSSFDADFDIKKSELNEEEVRLLLIEMISDNVLIQIFGDLYGIKQFQRDITVQPMVDGILANRAFRAAFGAVSNHDGTYDDKRLWEELGASSGLEKSDFILAISELASRNLASKNDSGMWTIQMAQKKIANHA